MNKYLPSKKFAKFIGGAILIVAIFWAFSMIYSKKQVFVANNKDVALANSEDTDDFYKKDSDGDGIYDWEEGLWGTNPNSKDSDDDGVSDGDAIAEKKKEIQEKNSFAETNTDDSEGLNQTEAFARQLLSTASLVEQGGGLTPESMESFSKAFGESIANAKIPDQFTLADMKLSSVDNTTYRAGLAQAFDEYRKSNISGIGTIYRLANGDSSADKDLDRLVKIYARLSENLLKMPTPHAVAGTQLVLINNTLKLSLVFQNMKTMADDPLVAVSNFKQYQDYSAEIEAALIRLTSYFSASGV